VFSPAAFRAFTTTIKTGGYDLAQRGDDASQFP
jgi:hypothetical protein